MQRTPVTVLDHLAVLLVLVALVALGGIASYESSGGVGAHAHVRADDKVPTHRVVTGPESD